MDHDLRQTNRLNLELMMLQNTAQNVMGYKNSLPGGGGRPGEAVRASRSKSLTGSGTGFPQSGVLPAASEFRAAKLSGDGGELVVASDGSPMMLRRATRTGSNDQDSGYSASGALNDDSRKSSFSLAPFGLNVPSIRLSVRALVSQPTRRAAAEQAATASGDAEKRSILHTLASIGRSASRQSEHQPDSIEQQQQVQEQVFEVQLLEARNMTSKQSSPKEVPRSKSRRESLLGALVAAAGSGQSSQQHQQSQRRSSVDGIFVRVFKHQSSGGRDQDGVSMRRADSSEHPHGPNSNPDGKPQFDSLSIHSTLSGNSSCLTATGGNEFIQTPLIKLQPSSDGMVSFGEEAGHNFLCRESEFPLRISLYQVSKRGGARFTLGHCFVSLADLEQTPVLGEEGPNWAPINLPHRASRQLSNASQFSDLSIGELTASQPPPPPLMTTNAKFLVLASSGLAQANNGGESVQLEYRLYQTILEAIK